MVLSDEEIELSQSYGPKQEVVLRKVKEEVRYFEGNAWELLQRLRMFGAKMGRQRIIGEFFQAA